jgi:hypothetical protein
MNQSQPKSNLDIIGSRFKVQGFQLGVEETNEDLLQSTFNIGFVQGVPMRFQDGYIRGSTTGSLLAHMLLMPKSQAPNQPEQSATQQPITTNNKNSNTTSTPSLFEDIDEFEIKQSEKNHLSSKNSTHKDKVKRVTSINKLGPNTLHTAVSASINVSSSSNNSNNDSVNTTTAT